jgi:hypothetical protein
LNEEVASISDSWATFLDDDAGMLAGIPQFEIL